MARFNDDKIIPATNLSGDKGYWIGYIGMGLEDVTLMSPEQLDELISLINERLIFKKEERYVIAAGQSLIIYAPK